jgi:hypothetical protein
MSSSSSSSSSRSSNPKPNYTQPPFSTTAVAAAANRDPPQPGPYQSSYERSYFPPDTAYFDEAITAYRSSPSPPPNNSFLDNILNPVSHSHSHSHSHSYSQPTEPSYLPFGYRQRTSPPLRRPRSPVLQTQRTVMSPPRPPRLPNGYVDLTTPDPAPARRKRQSVTPGPSAKRVRKNDGSAATTAEQEHTSPDTKIEAIDLSDDKVNMAEILQKQRADAMKTQPKPEEKPTTFNSFTCVICMDSPTDITATSCGE